jgi:hypothetical protein
MKLRHPKWSGLVAGIITVALSLSPVMAQTTANQSSNSFAPQHNEVAETTKDTGNPIVDSIVLPELPLAKTAMPFPRVSRNSTPSAASAFPTPPKPSSDDAPGQSKWIITATIVGAAAVTAIILLLRGFGGGGDDKPHPPTGTIIGAGTPSVSAPTH